MSVFVRVKSFRKKKISRLGIVPKASIYYTTAMTKFLSKFQFQINLQFYSKVEEITKIKLLMVIVKRFDKYHHLFNIYILITILFFHDWDSGVLNIKIL